MKKIKEVYEKNRLHFPIIGSVIDGHANGMIRTNSDENPTHIFVIHQFGFCAECFTTYDEKFAEEICKIIDQCDQKLRFYSPANITKSFLDEIDRAKKSRRIRYNICNADEKIDFVEKNIFAMKEIMKEYDFNLDLENRFYKNEREFIDCGSPLCIKTDSSEPIGIIYSAGFDGKRNEIDIFVDSKFRKNGIGKTLICAFADYVNRSNQTVSVDYYSNKIDSQKMCWNYKCGEAVEYDFYNIDPT